jgi:hypothetical protein
VDFHGPGNLVPLLIWGVFVIAAVRRWSKRRIPQAPVAAQPEPLARRRLAPPPARPIVPPVLPATARVSITPSMAETLPAEAAAAFPGLDLSLPGAEGPGTVAPRRRIRTVGGGPPLGSPGWAANAVVAAEILGPPVSLRPGATLGAPHAF